MSLRILTSWRCLLTTVLVAIHVASESQWQLLSPTGTAPTPRWGHSAVWRAGTGGMLVFGGMDSYRYLNDFYLYVEADGADEESRWQLLSPNGTAPRPRWGHSAVWRTGTGGMLLFGGRNDNDLYLYVDQEDRWQLLSPTGTAPTPRDSHSAVWRTGTGGMLLFGGCERSYGRDFNDLYLYLDQENQWQQLSPTGTAPTPRCGHTAVWRTGTGGMLVFGGFSRGRYFNDLFLYLDQDKKWQLLSPNGTAPAARLGHSAVWRTEIGGSGGMLLFGGYDGSEYFNDLYLYKENRWQLLSPSGTGPSPRECPSLVWRTTGMLLLGGSNAYSTRLNDLYELYMEEADPSGTSRPRTSTTAPTGTTKTSRPSANAETATTFGTTRTSTTAPTSSTNTSRAISFAGVGIEEDPVEQPTSTSTAGVSDPSEKMSWIPPNGQNQEDRPEDASAGVLLAVAMLSVLCLLSSLGILCWRRRKRQGNTGGEQVEIPNPLAILPALMPSAGVRPVIFAWNSRMTAEWPRGKVQNVVVEETSFQTRGRHFSFQQPQQRRQFIWQDGTIQRVDRIDKNVVWWTTQHEHPAWQQFRWVCTPQCQAEGMLHDMKLVESECSRCAICSSTRAAEKHWYCEQHEVHVCPACAELPPHPPTLGVSAKYLLDVFPLLARSSTAMENPNFYDICPHLAYGPTGIGYTMPCPRDGKQHCSMVDALEDEHSGKVTHFLSWCWAYRLEDVVTAVKRWVDKSSQSPEHVFLWICFFCNNQYRIKDEAVTTGSDDLKDIFEGHLIEAGQMLVLLDKIRQPTYVTRAWCIFESYVSIAQDIPMTMILPSGAEHFFRDTVNSGGIKLLSSAVRDLDVRNARAGSKQDEDLIKKIILNTTGFDAVNNAVRARLVKELTALFGELLTEE